MEVSNTVDKRVRVDEGPALTEEANHISGVPHETGGWEMTGRDGVDLEQSESGWQVYRKPDPIPPPMVSTNHDEDDSPPPLPPDEPAPPPPPPPSSPPRPLNTSRLRPCDKRVDLYVLQPDRLNASGAANPLKGKLTNCHATGCERPFSVQKIPHSNLILLVVDTLCPCGNKKLAIQPQEVVYEGAPCKGRNPRDHLQRRKPPKCISYHPEEVEIHACGSASQTALTASWVFVTFVTLVTLAS